MPAVVENQPGEEAAEAVGKHLPGRPGPLTEEEIAGKGRHGSGQKASLRPEGDAGDHDDAGDGFQVGRKGKHHPGYRCQSGHHREDHQFSCLGTPGLEPEEKGQHQLHDDHGADEVIPPALHLGAEKQCQGNQQENRKNGQQSGFAHHLPSQFCFSSAATSDAVTAFSKRRRLIRLAAVV